MTEVPESERALLTGAERRLGVIILLLVPIGAGVSAWQWGARTGVAFALGGALAYGNYRWIVAVVDALTRAQGSRVPRRTYLKLFGPLALLAVLLYVIFSRSWVPVAGFLGGLLLLVAAVVVEGIYQIVSAVRQ